MAVSTFSSPKSWEGFDFLSCSDSLEELYLKGFYSHWLPASTKSTAVRIYIYMVCAFTSPLALCQLPI